MSKYDSMEEFTYSEDETIEDFLSDSTEGISAFWEKFSHSKVSAHERLELNRLLTEFFTTLSKNINRKPHLNN